MGEFSSFEEIIDHAIGLEQAAVDLYTDLANRASKPAVQAVFLEYADEERGHKTKLLEIKSGQREIIARTKVTDLRIASYTVEVPLGENPSYQDVLIFAMHQEKKAFMLYTDLAQKTDDAGLKELLRNLAQEEAKHKLRFEIEYDEQVLAEN